MKFDDCVFFLYEGDSLSRTASAYNQITGGIFSKKKDSKKLISDICETKEKYCDAVNVKKTLAALARHEDADIRTTFSVLIGKVLLEKPDFCYETNSVTLDVLGYERSIVKKAAKLTAPKLSPEAAAYRQLLTVLYAGGRALSDEGRAVSAAMSAYYKLDTDDVRTVEASLGVYPTGDKFTVHTVKDIDKARQELQKRGILFSLKKNDGVVYDIIPEEIAASVREYFGIEMSSCSYAELIRFIVGEYKKQYLSDMLTLFGIDVPAKAAQPALVALTMKYLKPGELVGGRAASEGLGRAELSACAAKLGLSRTGGKTALAERICAYFRDLPVASEESDYRVRYYKSYADIACGKLGEESELPYGLSCGADGLFAETTNYIFEVLLDLRPDRMIAKSNQFGKITASERVFLYTSLVSEEPVDIAVQLDAISAAAGTEDADKLACVIVTAGAFTENSAAECTRFYAERNIQVLLITASELKDIADEWAKAGGDRTFPVIYLRKSGRFDKNSLKLGD